ncbi:MAG: hypothetical protein LQ346_002263 [Caloplaca aetnensis]|nr:MAG: hypothetical protein LQ346_002263 [Caloplaca aetnensis]
MTAASGNPEFTAQILSKDDYTKQSMVTLTSPPDVKHPLPPSAVRVRTALIALTVNNLGYAALGTQLHWWDTFPVPASAPPPFNDSSAYGMVPAWGYATVLSSTIPSITSGSLLWGCYPLSTHPVTLRLKPTSPQNHWLETSDHRKDLMPLYQRYVLAYNPPGPLANPSSAALEKLAKTALLKPLWEAAYLLNRFVFAPHQPSKHLPIHPFGQGVWTPKDGDLASAIVVIVAASSKTATAFASELRFSRASGTGPLAILSVAPKIPDHHIPDAAAEESSAALRNVTYDTMTEPATLDWLSSFSTAASKITIVDFGGRDSAADKLAGVIHEHPALAEHEVQVIGVGGGLKPNGSTQWKAGRVASNASTARDAAVERVGAEDYFGELEVAFGEMMWRGALGLEVQVGSGMEGKAGVEGGWMMLCDGGVDGRTGLVFWI